MNEWIECRWLTIKLTIYEIIEIQINLFVLCFAGWFFGQSDSSNKCVDIFYYYWMWIPVEMSNRFGRIR